MLNRNMPFGIYVHIPYCLKRCSYCDFATFELGLKKMGYLEPGDYVDLVCREIQVRGAHFKDQELTSVYFGGGTPSLIEPILLESILSALIENSFVLNRHTEITLEINPETLTDERLEQYLNIGFNRFSVGAQTFHPQILRAIGREHGPEQILKTLDLLRSRKLNYSFDLLFALPEQTLADVETDLKIVSQFSPPHLSAYCLTVPTGHPLEKHRPFEDVQIQMFASIEASLRNIGLRKYEISNFSRPGFESKHNMLYWKDENYLGFGLSAHSHLALERHGKRFWNPKTFIDYKKMVLTDPSLLALTQENSETLTFEEALTDYCHVSLRLSEGMNFYDLRYRFGNAALALVRSRVGGLADRGLVELSDERLKLTRNGELLSNQVFADLLFSK